MAYTFKIDRLKAAFSKSKLTYKDAADRTGISQSTIHSIFQKGDMPRISTLLILCDYYGVSPKSLFVAEEEC